MDERLIRYIKENVEKGHHPDKIKAVLMQAGHNPAIVEEHIRHVRKTGKKKKIMPLFLTAVFLIAILVFSVRYFQGSSEPESAQQTAVQSKTASYQDFSGVINKALIEKDQSICNQITNQKIKEDCRNGFSAASECDSLCKEKKILNRALIERNSSICLEINNESLKKQCKDLTKLA